MSTFYLKVIMFGCLPVIISIFGFIIWSFVKLTCKKKDTNFHVKRNMLVTSFVMIFLLYPDITRHSFSLFHCFSFEDGNSYLQNDMSITCWQGNHMRMALTIGIPFIILWTFVFPIVIFVNLLKKRTNLNDKDTLATFGLFYVGLNDKAFFWEVVIVNVRKIIFVMCVTLI